MVARHVAVQQMAVQPIGTGSPMHLAQMHHVAGQPHARMVVQVAGGIQLAHRRVDGRHAGAAFADVGRQRGGIGTGPQVGAAHVVQQLVALAAPDMVKKLAPRELEHQLVFEVQPVPLHHARHGLAHADHAVREVGRQAAHRAVERVAAERIAGRVQCVDAAQRLGVRGLELLQPVRDTGNHSDSPPMLWQGASGSQASPGSLTP